MWTHKRKRQLENKNEQGDKRHLLQGVDIVKFIKSSRISWYGHVERMQNQRMPKQIAAATIEAIMERGRPRKRWKDEVEEDLNIMGIKNGRAETRDRR
jgi:hypothetical protein